MTTKTKLDQQFVSELSERKGEPAWMRERRLAAWEQFETLPVPHYERTRLRDSHFQSFEPYTAATAVDSFDELPEDLKEAIGDPEGRALVVQHHSDTVFQQLPELPEGVIVTDFATAVKEHEELVKILHDPRVPRRRQQNRRAQRGPQQRRHVRVRPRRRARQDAVGDHRLDGRSG